MFARRIFVGCPRDIYICIGKQIEFSSIPSNRHTSLIRISCCPDNCVAFLDVFEHKHESCPVFYGTNEFFCFLVVFISPTTRNSRTNIRSSRAFSVIVSCDWYWPSAYEHIRVSSSSVCTLSTISQTDWQQTLSLLCYSVFFPLYSSCVPSSHNFQCAPCPSFSISTFWLRTSVSVSMNLLFFHLRIVHISVCHCLNVCSYNWNWMRLDNRFSSSSAMYVSVCNVHGVAGPVTGSECVHCARVDNHFHFILYYY